MRLKLIAITTMMIGLHAGVAEATFVSGAGRWSAMGSVHQQSYAMGLLEQSMKSNEHTHKGLMTCARRHGLDGKTMAKSVSRFYAANPGRTSLPPSSAFQMAVVRNKCGL